MKTDPFQSLEEGKRLFYEWRLAEAYHCFRRYFDRIPFKPEKEHAENMGMFVRILLELGKDFELKFYLSELEKWFSRSKSPEIAFALAVVYRYQDPPKWKECFQLFQNLQKQSLGRSLDNKAKMWLADYYEEHDDLASCKCLIDSIAPGDDKHMMLLVEIWKAYILKRQGSVLAAYERLKQVENKIDVKEDWYGYFCAKDLLVSCLISLGNIPEANAQFSQLHQMFEGRHFRTIQRQLNAIQSELSKRGLKLEKELHE